MRKIHVLLLMGVEAVLLCAGVAVASRNSSGTMSAINGPYAAPNVISSAAINARFADIESELSDSKSRSGKGDFSAPVRGANGTNTAPTYAFTSETTAGLYRNGAGDLRFAFNGTDVAQYQATGVTFPLAATVTGAATFNGTATFNANGANPGATVSGAGQTSASYSTSGTLGGSLLLSDTGASSGNGGALIFGLSQGRFAAIKGFGTDGTNNTVGDIVLAVRSGSSDSTLTERLRVVGGASGGIKISTGVAGDGSGFKHITKVTGCSTGASIGSTCTDTVTFTTTFADASYDASCNCAGTSSGVPVVSNIVRAAATITVTTAALTASSASCQKITCIAVHD